MNMKREERFSWFFNASWIDLKKLMVDLNTGTRMMAALKAVHSGKMYHEAGEAHGLSKQSIYQWLSNRGDQIKSGRISIG